MTDPTVVIDQMSYLEGPRWRDGRIWVSDCYTRQVLSAREDGSDLRIEAELSEFPSGTGVLTDGRLLIVSMRDQRILRREPDGSLVTHADLSSLAIGEINDMAVDPQGRCWVGCFGFDLQGGADIEPANLIRVDPDGHAEVVADNVIFPNGVASDGRTLVVAESFDNCLSAFDVESDGSLTNRREWARFGDRPTSRVLSEAVPNLDVAPDGIANPDAEGAIWVADAFHHRAIRVQEGGKILDEVVLPDLQVYAVALGGEARNTLFLATAPGFDREERMSTREAKLLAVTVDVPAA